MPLPVPNLDDRRFADLVAEARQIVATRCPEWTDLSPGDPGMVLVEVFAHLTEVMTYRLNRLPEKAYIAFLNLLGVAVAPPSAAGVELRFTLARPAAGAVEIPRGTRVTVQRGGGAGGEAPVFATDRPATIPAGALAAAVRAHHCDWVEGELAGRGTGLPGQWLEAQRPPIVAPTGDALDLVVGVEAAPGELDQRLPALQFAGKAYRVWRAVESFADPGEAPFVYTADRATGTITFAPAARLRTAAAGADGDDAVALAEVPRALAEVPAAGREIRLWYRRGGGSEGNLAAGTLTVLKNPIPGLDVTNAQAATGGRAAETLANALVRGPQEFHSLQRAVTARDFELLALRSSGAVARAHAITQAALWVHATPGTVEVLLVPYVGASERPGGRIGAADLAARESEEARTQIQAALDERRPLGTACLAHWASYKTVSVRARVVARAEENLAALRDRVLARLYWTLSPLPAGELPAVEGFLAGAAAAPAADAAVAAAPAAGGGASVGGGPAVAAMAAAGSSAAVAAVPRRRGQVLAAATGWRFGQALRASHVYDLVLAEPGVSYVDQVALVVEGLGDPQVPAIAADATQRGVWYAGAGEALLRSVNDGEGWESMRAFAGETVERLRSHPQRPGLVALLTHPAAAGAGSNLYVSRDCGERWEAAAETAFTVQDVAWTLRDGVAVLLLASDAGLHELALRAGATPVQVLVDAADHDLGFYAVAASTSVRGEQSVAVAAQGARGIFLSSQGGATGSFHLIAQGLSGEDVRVLAVQELGVRSFLWAGVAAAGGSQTGKGAFRWELRGGGDAPEGWQPFTSAWQGGTCWSLAFQGSRVLAATHQAGVLRLDAAARDAAWQAPEIGCGLPLRDTGRLHPVRAVACDPDGRLLLAGGPAGLFRSADGGEHFDPRLARVFADKVTLPETWLFCSGEHAIDVVSEDETGGH